jgi:hypothetical protein
MRGALPASEPEPNGQVATGPQWTELDLERGLPMTGYDLLRARLVLFLPCGSATFSTDKESS